MDENTKMDPQQEELSSPAADGQDIASKGIPTAGGGADTPPKKKKPQLKLKKENLPILGIIAVVLIAGAFLLLHKSEFERVHDECLDIAGQITGSGDDYFTIDTYPYEGMDADVAAIMAPRTQTKALEAIKHANEELGFSGAVYSQMMQTSALMGRQSAENDKYEVSWTYHPDRGLEVTYEKK